MMTTWRIAVWSIALLTVGYALWLLLVGVPVQVSDLPGSSVTGRQSVLSAIVPLVFGILVLVGLGRASMSMAWTGAVGVLGYGLLAIFGMGIAMPILGLLLVMAMTGQSIAVRRALNRSS